MHTEHRVRPAIYGLMAEFDNPNDAIRAAEAAYTAGYRKMDAYSPYPVEELSEAVGFKKNRVPLVCLLGGLTGMMAGYGLEYWTQVINYPLIIGGKPFHSWPAFIPVTFETTVLFAGLSTAIGMLAMNGLPQPYHPVFNVPQFERASIDRFFVLIEATDAKFDLNRVRDFLQQHNAISVSEVPH